MENTNNQTAGTPPASPIVNQGGPTVNPVVVNPQTPPVVVVSTTPPVQTSPVVAAEPANPVETPVVQPPVETPKPETEAMSEEIETLSGEVQALESKLDKLATNLETGQQAPVASEAKVPLDSYGVKPVESKSPQMAELNTAQATVVPPPMAPPMSPTDLPAGNPAGGDGGIDISQTVPGPTPASIAAEKKGKGSDGVEITEDENKIASIGDKLVAIGVVCLMLMVGLAFLKDYFGAVLWSTIATYAWPAFLLLLLAGFVMSMFAKGKMMSKIVTAVFLILFVLIYLSMQDMIPLGPLDATAGPILKTLK